jgi:carboxyl-terminal processing protease
VIETVNGEPALSVVSERLTGSSASTRASLRFRLFAKLLEGPPETSVAISWKRKDGQEKSGRFDRHWQQRELGVRVRREKGSNLVIEIDVFTKATALSFANVLKKKLNGAQGIVLDLRGNGGGDAEAMTDIASAFLGDGLNLGRFTDRSGVSFTISTHSRSLFMPERIVRTKLPLIVLTSERTSSAAEILAAALKTAGRAILIGTETCGCVLAIRTRHSLPDGGVLDVSELDYQTASGERLEGQGVKPDQTVMLERNDLYSGRDRAMERAVANLRKLARHY